MELVIYKPTETEFLQEIQFNHEEIKKELAVRLEKYNGLVYTEENIKDAKADRANLNKFKDAIEGKRKEIKKQCLKPYEEFESKIKEITAMIDKPILAIDSQVKAYEQIKKDEKLAAIKQFYADKVMDLEELVPFSRIYKEKWLNVTYKEADIQKEITDLFIKVEADLKVIDELETPYKLQIKDTYLKDYDLTAALQEKKRLEDQAAKLAEYEKQQKAKHEAAAEITPDVSEPVKKEAPAQEAPHVGPEPPKKMFEVDFRVTGTADELNALKKFMIDNGIKFAPVPKDERKVG
jgi:hypothetical protein